MVNNKDNRESTYFKVEDYFEKVRDSKFEIQCKLCEERFDATSGINQMKYDIHITRHLLELLADIRKRRTIEKETEGVK